LGPFGDEGWDIIPLKVWDENQLVSFLMLLKREKT
jgi:hypothetical protein